MTTVVQDLRYAVRMLIRMRGAAVVAIATLALGIAATTTVFSIVYAALLRPLPFADPDRLVLLYVTRTTPRDGLQKMRWSQPEIAALGSKASSLEEVASFTSSRVNLTSNGEPEQIYGEVVTPGYLRILRLAPQIGRTFDADEDLEPGGHPVAVISARLWQRRFGSDPAIIGRSIGINRVSLTIVGVLPATFSGLSGRAELWIPTTMAPRLTYGDYLTTPQHFINLVGRLQPGISLEQAAAELETIGPHVVVAERSPAAEPAAWSATLGPLANARIDAANRRSALLLLAAVACVLLIACVNVASVLLARARARRREIAVKLAIGAGRAQIVRQLLTESLVLAAIGGACGTLVAIWSVDFMSLPEVIASQRNGYAQIGAFAGPAMDRAVLLFALAVTIGTSVLFGLAPALDSSRADLVTALKEDERSVAGGPQRRLLAGFVVSEVALAVLLLAGAGLLLKSFAGMQNLRAGFVPDRVLTFWVSPPVSQYAPADGPAIVERLLTSIQRAPGVVSAAINRCTPFATSCSRTLLFFADRRNDAARAPGVGRHYISADYFRTLGIPVRAGRTLTDEDRAGRPPVTVINETAARRFWPGENAVGKRVWFGSTTGGAFASPAHPVEVVGIVGDVKYGQVDEAVGPDFYTSYLQFSYPDTMVVVKTDRDVSAIVPSMRSAVSSVDSGLPIYDVQSLDDRIRASMSRPRFNAAVLAVFAGAALLLAAVGVYGVMAYSVSFRLHEIGVRLALGAGARRVLGLVLGESARLAGLGAAIGLAGALALTRLMRSVLYGVAPNDPLILATVTIVILIVALAAAFLPARRAATVDPMSVLRNE
jgi:predicted permease